MQIKSAFLAAACTLAISFPAFAAPQHPTLPFSGLTVVDEIDCAATISGTGAPYFYKEGPGSVTTVSTILGSSARVMANPEGGPSNPTGGTFRYFSYRIGYNKGLQAGKAYVLEVEYPEDAPRSFVIINQGEAGSRGLHTGPTVGDALNPPYVNNNPESLDIPLSNSWKTWRTLFHLHDRFMDMTRARAEGTVRPLTPEDGFNVIIVHYWHEDDPLSAGAAVRKIRLLEAPDLETYDANIMLPPEGLPRRHIFSREEMFDGIAGLMAWLPENQRGVKVTRDYYEYRARLMRFLGMNTFSKDLLEFGGNQGFDNKPGGGNSWYYNAKDPTVWENIVEIANEYGLDVLPYYEYAGSEGSNGLGGQKRAKPLSWPGMDAYTQVSWAESSRADLSDPDTHADAKLLLDTTVTRYRNKANFIGAWWRARVSQMPISFNDNNIAQFSNEVLGGRPITREQLRTTVSVYNQYIDWFFTKRRDFVLDMRDHLRAQGVNKNAEVLYTSDATEPGRSYVPPGQSSLVAESPSLWTDYVPNATSLSQAVSEGRHRRAMTGPRGTYSGWEWQHADPWNDPANYANTEGAYLTYTFNRKYTLDDPAFIEEFRTQSGLAMVRHFSLNEGVLDDNASWYTGPDYTDPLGYFVTDFERTGPFSVMPEALALANGDPRYLGYLSSTTMNRGFPEYVRAFNRAFLALPAVSGTIRSGASSNANVVARDYPTDGYGTYMGIVNTARTDQNGVVITFPERSEVVDATTGTMLSSGTTSLSFDLYPFEVKALLLRKRTVGGPIAVDDHASVNEGGTVNINVLSNDGGPGTKTLQAVGTASHGTVTIVSNQARYVPEPGFHGKDTFSYTVSNGTDTDKARVYVTVNNTQVAGDLSSWGIRALSMGAEDTGRARILSGGTVGEITGFGSGPVGLSDQGYFETTTVSGDFQMTMKINSVSGSTSDALAGLMIRQSTDTSARMVAALVNSSSGLQVFSRKIAGEESVGNPLAGTTTWLRMKREGDLITVLKASSQAGPYTEVAWRTFPGLPATLQAGIWASGGDRYTGSRALVESFSIVDITSGALFSQSFPSSGTSAYVSSSPNSGQFNDLSVEADGGTWSVNSDGVLQLVTTTTTSANDDGGFTRFTPLSPLGNVLKFSARIGVNNVGTTNAFADMAVLDFGDFASKTDYGSSTLASNIYAQITLRGAGAGLFRFKLDHPSEFYSDPVDGHYIGDGRLYRMTVYISQSTSDETYYGPDGQQHTLNAGMVSLWMNDRPVKENWSRTALNSNFAGTAPKAFKFRQGGGYGRSYFFDDIHIEPRVAAPTPSRSNSAPQAVDDSGIQVPESTPILLDVLANDSDPDAGPDALRLTSASASSGVATIENNRILFVPAPGFVGNAVISYTISDGLASDTGEATVNVTSTATASNLVAAGGLSGSAIGSGVSGGSRVLSDGYWEVLQTGGAGTATSDKLWWERKSVSGDFEAEVRIREMQSLGTGAVGGLMIRETTATGSRMVRLTLDPAGAVKAESRTSSNGSLAQTGTSTNLTYPAAWLQLERSGTSITARVSSDGVAFTDLGTVSLSSLASSLDVGLWTTNARMAATGFVIRPYQPELLKIDFNQSTDLAFYARELDPEPNQLSEIKAEPQGGTWSIDSGRLKIVRTSDNGPDSGAGFIRSMPFPGDPPVLKVSFDLHVQVNSSTTNMDLMHFELGNFPVPGDYNSGIVSAPHFSRLTIRSRGLGKYAFRFNSANSPDYLSSSGSVPVVFYANNSGQTQNYQTPDGNTRQLDHRCVSLWVGDAGGNLRFDNVAVPSAFTSSTIATFRFRMTAPDFTAYFDNLVFDTRLVPPGGNQAPVAVDDTVTAIGGQANVLSVLSNDSDSDGPSSLTIGSITTPAHGTATRINGNTQIQYTPSSSYYGPDTFDYTVTDGVDTDTATVFVNVIKADNLAAYGLSGQDIGSGSGSGVDLDGVNIEVNGIGAGIAGTSDNYHAESKILSGEVLAVVKVEDLAGGSAARAGLVLRESTGVGSRLAAISLGGDGLVRSSGRSTTNGSVSTGTASGSWSTGTTWLMVERIGDMMRVCVSDDGAEYEEVTRYVMSSLSSSLQVGLWAAGGNGSTNARAVFSEFEASVQPIVMAQDFQDWTSGTSNYVSSTPTRRQFDDLTAASPTAWTVSGGRLKLAYGSSNTGGSGFIRYVSGTMTPNAVVVRMQVAMTNVSGSGPIGYVDIGSMTSLISYNSTTNAGIMGQRLTFKRGNGTFKVDMNGSQGTSSFPADGSSIPVEWYINYSGSSIQYLAPDLTLKTLASGYNDVWINGILEHEDVARPSNFNASNLGAVRFRTEHSSTAGQTFEFDEIDIRELTP